MTQGRKISVTVMNGQHAGKTATADDISDAGVTIADVLSDLATRGIRWEVTYPDDAGISTYPATDPQIVEWATADISGRILSAAIHGRSVRLMGVIWGPPALSELGEWLARIEDAIVGSGMIVTVVSDDDHELIIGAVQPPD